MANSKGVSAVTLTEMAAKTFGGVYEFLKDEFEFDRLVILAPHGGEIEPYTASIAKLMYYTLFNRGVPAALWIVQAYRPGGGAYAMYHVPSTEFDTQSFPKLGTLLGRNFRFSISIHGTKGSQVLVGGTAEGWFKEEIAELIIGVTGNLLETVIVSEGPHAGVHPDNVVNRFSKCSIQLELPMNVRKSYGTELAYALAEFYRTRI